MAATLPGLCSKILVKRFTMDRFFEVSMPYITRPEAGHHARPAVQSRFKKAVSVFDG
jgi:hypothetical protein